MIPAADDTLPVLLRALDELTCQRRSHFTVSAKNFLIELSKRLSAALNSAFVINAGRLFGFTVVGQFVTLVAAPFLSRHYSPAEFGLFGIFSTFSTVVSGLICLNYDTAIPSPRDNKEAVVLLHGASITCLLMCLFIALAYAALLRFDVLGYGVMPSWTIIVLILLLAAFGTTSIQQYWCIRRQSFVAVGQGIVILNTTRACIQLGLGMFGAGWFGLAVGDVLARAWNTTFLWRRLRRDILQFCAEFDIRSTIRVLLKYRRFSVVLLPPILIDAIAGALLLPALSVLFGVAVAGQYFLMRRIMDLPMVVLTRTVADAFHGKISELARENPHAIRPFLLSVFLLCVSASFILLTPLMFFGPSIFALAFGEKWRLSGLLAAIMSPAIAVALGSAPVARIFFLTRLPQLRYVFSVLMALGLLVALVAARTVPLSVTWTTVAISIVTFLAYFGYFLSAYYVSSHVHIDQSLESGTVES